MSRRHHKHGQAESARHASKPQTKTVWVKPAPKPVDYDKKYAKHPRYYVGYGSNHNVIQMQARCIDAMPVVGGLMPDTLLVFSRVLTVEHVEGEQTPVSVWHVSPRDIGALDRYEGYPHLYGKRYTHVTVRGERHEAFYYTLNDLYDEEPADQFYYATVEEGYKDWGFDTSYLRAAQDRAEAAEAARPKTYCAVCGKVFPRHQLVTAGWGESMCLPCASGEPTGIDFAYNDSMGRWEQTTSHVYGKYQYPPAWLDD
jgi:hypothetical protein